MGSTIDFNRRYKEHTRGNMNPEFNRSLQKNPENFYWVVGDDDGLDTRDEEQYYLDFYHGTMWCYNLCDTSEHPGSEVSRKGGLTTHSKHPDLFSRNGKKVGEFLKETNPNHFSTMGKEGGKQGKGKVWWNDGEKETRATQSPGENWNRGRLIRSK